MLMAVVTLVLACALCLVAQDKGNSWGPVIALAAEKSKLTSPDGKPFHLEAKIVETTNPESDYRDTVEEDWVSPEKWRRTVDTPEFSQTLIVNPENVSENDHGDYFPLWLSDMMTALVDPMPGLAVPDRIDPHAGDKLPHGAATICTGAGSGSDRWHFCLDPRKMVLTSVILDRNNYEAEIQRLPILRKALGRTPNRRQPGTRNDDSGDYHSVDRVTRSRRTHVSVDQPTPPQDRINGVWIDEPVFRDLVQTDMTINWPPVGSGLTKGGCTVYVSADRSGHIREVWPGGCDNAGLEDPLRDIVRKWQLKTAVSHGVPVQVGARLTFPFTTTVSADPVPMLKDAEARALATNVVEPAFPPGADAQGTQVVVEISVDETGKYAGIENTHNVPDAALFAADAAIRQWRFSPYMKTESLDISTRKPSVRFVEQASSIPAITAKTGQHR